MSPIYSNPYSKSPTSNIKSFDKIIVAYLFFVCDPIGSCGIGSDASVLCRWHINRGLRSVVGIEQKALEDLEDQS